MTLVLKVTVTDPDSSRGLLCQHTKVPCCRFTWYPPSNFNLTLGQPALLYSF